MLLLAAESINLQNIMLMSRSMVPPLLLLSEVGILEDVEAHDEKIIFLLSWPSKILSMTLLNTYVGPTEVLHMI
jgi:hypothetical protein